MTTLTLRSKKPASLGDRGKKIKENRKATYKKKNESKQKRPAGPFNITFHYCLETVHL